MLQGLFIPLSEMLFWFTSGELLINTVWFAVWMFGGAIVIASPMLLCFHFMRHGNVRRAWISGTVFLISFFPLLLVLTSPGIIQNELMKECLPIQTVTIDTDLVNDLDVYVRHCRVKDNYYDTEYGPWTAFTVE